MLAALRHNEIDEDAMESLRRATTKYFARPYVTGVDIGLKITDGVHDASRGPVIRVHVAEKRPRRTLKDGDLIPARIGRQKTDVVEARYCRADCTSLAVRADRADPLVPGIRIGVAGNGYGTLGVFVSKSGDSVRRYFVTAGHVVLRGGHSAAQQIFQPSAGVVGAAVVAATTDTHRGLDAALCEMAPEFASNRRPIDATVDVAGCALPTIGMSVQKSGVASCLTQGIVDGLGEYRDVAIGDEMDGVGPAFRVIPEAAETATLAIALPGDSGSVWFDPISCRAVGLHVRGPDHVGGGEQFAIATLMTSIADAFNITIP